MSSTIINDMRISESNIQTIRATFKNCFGSNDHLWVFGSRVNDLQRGGDMDFYIETEEDTSNALNSKMKFVNALWKVLGEQKIDVVLNVLSQSSLPIYQIAKSNGVLIA